jgi:hypothetical protein
MARLSAKRSILGPMRITRAAVLAAALLLAGCGGGGETAGEGGGNGGGAGDQEAVLAYENGYQQCTGFPVKDLAETYNADEATKEAVADAVARANPGAERLDEPTRQGCLDAIDKKPFKPSGEHGPETEES